MIQQKELEQKLLESQLNDTKTENVKQKEDMLKIKEDILHNFADLMETELQCAICSELFIFVSCWSINICLRGISEVSNQWLLH